MSVRTALARRRRPGGFVADSRQARHLRHRCPEIDCLRNRLPPGTAFAAEQRALDVGMGADRVLVGNGLPEEAYLTALAATLGVEFETLQTVPRSACPVSDAQLLQAATVGLLPMRIGREIGLVIAPRGTGARWLVEFLHRHPEARHRFRLTSHERLRRFVGHFAADEIAFQATETLRARRPEMSAASANRRIAAVLAAGLAAMGVVALLTPTIMLAFEAALAIFFLAAMGLRLAAALAPRPVQQILPHADGQLPIYTIICALYGEAGAIGGLVAALRCLDYPREKLDIKLVLEADDAETLAAARGLRLGPPFEIVIAPRVGPRTKPKALNAALAFARGTFVAVYDAEDRPEPGQLKRALDAFLAADHALGCVQARLTIDNTGDSWLARLFTAEYAGLFDVSLPGIAQWNFPLPLGGSSNHFRGIR